MKMKLNFIFIIIDLGSPPCQGKSTILPLMPRLALPRSPWPRRLPLLLLLLLLATLAGAAWLYSTAQRALPQLDGAVYLPGLHHRVTVVRDAHGVPHISAASLDDLLFAQGYVTAQDRLW